MTKAKTKRTDDGQKTEKKKTIPLKEVDITRIPTYIEGYDSHLDGGIPTGHVVLVSGTAGTMKSSVVFNIFYNEVLNNKATAVYLSLEQSSRSLLTHLVNMGYDLTKIPLELMDDISKLGDTLKRVKNSKEGMLVFIDVGAVRKELKAVTNSPSGDWINVLKNILKKFRTQAAIDLFCVDSLSALYVLSEMKNPRTELFHIFEFLRDSEVTSFLISEMPLDKNKLSEYEIEDFLADSVIMLELKPRQRRVMREISTVKMRSTNANTDIFTLEFEKGKFKALHGGQTPLV